jgi:hypothetical protein
VASLTFVTPILPEKGEAWRRFYQELSGSRRTEYERSRRRLGITRECVWVSQTPQREIAIVSIETEDPEQVISQVATSDLPFDRWFRQQMKELHGLDVTQPKAAPPKELIFTWQIS